jgi:hypothetical protein
VESAEFSADGRFVLTASTDGTARAWFVGREDLFAHVQERLGDRHIPGDTWERYPELLGEAASKESAR